VTGAFLAWLMATAQEPPRPSAGPSPADAQSPTAPSAGVEPLPPPTPPLDCRLSSLAPEERDTLIRLAWRTLSGHLTQRPIQDADLEAYSFTPCLLAPRGLFVTLKKGAQVRGRQGEIEPSRPLYQQVIVFTRRAATRDPRFTPLTAQDLDALTVELSVIGERRKVDKPSEIRLDADGIFLEKWGRRTLFLPGFAALQGWTAERTLDELCSQASLPKRCWSESARLEGFAAESLAGAAPPSAATEPKLAPAPSPAEERPRAL
jgi:uncharacterized protein